MMTETAVQPPKRLIRRPEVLTRTGICRTQIDNLEAAGTFPNRVRLGPRSVGWVEAEVDEWIAQRIAASRSPKPATSIRARRKPQHSAR